MKVAFATCDGATVNEHFGRAATFAIYEFTEGGYRRLDDRCFGEGRDQRVEGTRDQGALHDDAVESKVDRLADCGIIYMTQIGGPSAARLVRRGIMPVKVEEGKVIDAAAQELLETIRQGRAPWLKKAMRKTQQEDES
ncbi:MAG: NifB/NifX family molybdenum-iron cluster-binding protein [bacterium]|nr:NifB/NifX family molybdenum-iron cluster-binding protein [bacterium]